jgi:uncharacterized membrane protein YqiK
MNTSTSRDVSSRMTPQKSERGKETRSDLLKAVRGPRRLRAMGLGLVLGGLLLPGGALAQDWSKAREEQAKAEAKYVEERAKAGAKALEEEEKARAKSTEERAKGQPKWIEEQEKARAKAIEERGKENAKRIEERGKARAKAIEEDAKFHSGR